MSFHYSTVHRYVPHSDTTKAHYEQLLRDIRRTLPPGVDEDLEDIAEEVLGIVCTGTTTGEAVQQQQAKLERLFDTALRRDTRDQLLRYGKLITDYVGGPAAGSTADGNKKEQVYADDIPRGVMDIDEAEGPSSSSSCDAEGEDMALLTGMGRMRRGDAKKRKALRQDKHLSLYAFSAPTGEEDFHGAGGSSDGGPEDGGVGNMEDWDADEGALAPPKISFDEVACNPSYVRDALRRLFPAQNVETCEAQTLRVVAYLAERTVDDFTLETQLTAYLGGYDDESVMDWIADVCGSRWCIVYGLRYAACTSQKEKSAVMDGMREHASEAPRVEHLYQSLTGKEVNLFQTGTRQAEDSVDEEGQQRTGIPKGVRQPPLRRVDLQACAFQDERTPHRHVRATVPQGTHRAVFDTHDEVVLPPGVAHVHADPLVPISSFPEWCHAAFKGVEYLNPMQSKVSSSALGSDENLLVSAPTGAGKTNVAMMAMLRAVQNTMSTKGVIDLRDLKMVYVAPMKALVQEVVRTFSDRLAPLGLTVAELSGDSSMTQQQLLDTQLIVTTPEKWDIVTRKSIDLGVASLLKLLIIDEVHLLHNERGPVLEAIVARTLIQQQLRGAGGIRIVGLSATLPNYEDVAAFLQVDRQRGLHVFDNTFRPIPLEQTYCAIKKVRGVNHAAVMNRIVYDKVLQAAQDHEQVMIFVHSRKETEYTAMYLKNRALEERHGHHFIRPGSDHERALLEATSGAEYQLRNSLQQLLPAGFAIHHAGLSRDERHAVEVLFGDRRIKVLVCTSTLAWGVNLPANRVIIKGTRVFNGAKGESELLSALDVFQMFGRAGRVGFGATVGRAAIITSAEDLHYYLGVLNQQLPIESQLMRRVVDMLNAEITLGHVETTKEGVRWLQRTYLYVRMRKMPEVYGIRPNPQDPLLLQHLENIVHTACNELKLVRMADYDPASRKIGPTAYGRIASHCYVTAASMQAYLAHLSNALQEPDLFRIFCMSSEFASLSVRAEEQAQLKELLECAPIAVKESRYTPLAKINILLQCYISRKNLEGLPLMSEMVYIKDSAQRILRALYEICLVREYGRTARQFLQLYGMVLHRQWAVESPVRQVQGILSAKNVDAILPTLERLRVTWEELRCWSVDDLAEKLTDDRRAGMAHELIHHVPHYTVDVAVRPLTRGMLYADIDLTPDFTYRESVHGRGVGEVLLTVEHPSGRILHHEIIHLPVSCLEAGEAYACAAMVVPMTDPKPTHLYFRVTSLQWLAAEASVAVCLLNVELPAVAPPLLETHQRPTNDEVNDMDVANVLEPYQLAAVGDKIFPFTEFYASQRDLVAPILGDSLLSNVYAGMPPGGGKTVVAELFVLQFLMTVSASAATGDASGDSQKRKKILYLTCHEDVAERRYMDWRFKFGESLGQSVVKIDGTQSREAQLPAVAAAAIVVATGASIISWVRTMAPVLLDVTHIVADHLHVLRTPEGRFLEEALARLQASPFLVHDGTQRARLLALSYPLISCLELCKWLRIPSARQYNLGTSYRQLRVRLDGLDLPSRRGRYETSLVSVFKQIQRPPFEGRSAVLFVPTAREAEGVAKRVVLRCRDFTPDAPIDDAVDDGRLGMLLAAGVAFVHRGTTPLDLLTVMERLDQPARHPETQRDLPLVVVCSFDVAGRLPAAAFGTAWVCCAERLSAVADTDAAGHQSPLPLDCTASELLQMTSRAAQDAVVFCRATRRWVWSRLLNEPLPLESNLRYPSDFADAVNAAVAQKRATTRMDVLRVLQSHYFLYHLRTNAAFYSVTAVEDVPLFASDVASRVVLSLQEQGCLEVLPSGGGAAEDDDDDPYARLRSTVRGMALARHCISVDFVQRLTEAVTHAQTYGMLRGVAAMWRLVCRESDDLSATFLGDAARVTDVAELRALQTMARAIPPRFDVRSVDLDVSQGSGKVCLLVLAYCARWFNAAGGGSPHQHPFQDVDVATPGDVKLLCDIPVTVVLNLVEDLQAILPAATRVVTALVEGLGVGSDDSCVVNLMELSQCLRRRVWVGEAPLAQLSTAARPGWLPTMVREGVTLDTVQTASETSTSLNLLTAALEKNVALLEDGTTPLETAKRLCAEAQSVPRVRALRADGSIEEVDGQLAIVVRVTAHIQWEGGRKGEDELEAEEGQWWLRCTCLRQDKPTTGKLMALQVVSLPPSEGGVATQSLTGRLTFPLKVLEAEGSLDDIALRVGAASVAYRVSTEEAVVFDIPEN